MPIPLDNPVSPKLNQVHHNHKYDNRKPGYIQLFVEIWNGADTCNNVSRLRSYADKASALKIRLLDEMNDLDAELAAKKAQAAQKDNEDAGTPATDIVVDVPVKKTKNVTIKNVARTSSWRIEKAEDVDKYIDQLKKTLLDELNNSDIINVEF